MFNVDGFDVKFNPDVINAGGIENFVNDVTNGENAKDLLNSFAKFREYIRIVEFDRGDVTYALDLYYSNDLKYDWDKGCAYRELVFIIQFLNVDEFEITGKRKKEVIAEWPVEITDLVEKDTIVLLNNRRF